MNKRFKIRRPNPAVPPIRRGVVLIVFFLACRLSLGVAHAAVDVRPLIMDSVKAIYAGNYEAAEQTIAAIAAADPSHPSSDFYHAVVLFWRNAVDPSNPDFDAQIIQHLDTCIAKARVLLGNDKDSIDALHYLGLAYTYLGRLEAHRGKLYSGGVKGETGRKYLEKGIRLCELGSGRPVTDPPASESGEAVCSVCEDLYFPYGAYTYFAGRLPRFLKLFNFLWFIPSGSADEGLAALERARAKSCLHSLGATSLLATIYELFEPDTGHQSLALSAELIARFPDNPYLDLEHARRLLAAGHYPKAAAHATAVIKKTASGKPHYDKIVRLGAELVIAEADLRRGFQDAFENRIKRLRMNPSSQNNTLTPLLDLLEGMAADMAGKRDTAIRFYETAAGHEGRSRNRMAAKQAKRYMKSPFILTPL